ncbi:MAG: hypothetical protein LBF95_07905, partial [Treponema sp.]|nr:hypothetical protein [Treponema sp.]
AASSSVIRAMFFLYSQLLAERIPALHGMEYVDTMLVNDIKSISHLLLVSNTPEPSGWKIPASKKLSSTSSFTPLMTRCRTSARLVSP